MPSTRKAAGADYQKRIVRQLRHLTQKLDGHSRQLLSRHDITMPQIICLDELNERGPRGVTLLAQSVHLSPSTLVGIIDRLEKKQFVRRTRGTHDRRSVSIDITDAGRRFLAATPQLLHNKLQRNLKRLPEADRIRIAESLDALLALMG